MQRRVVLQGIISSVLVHCVAFAFTAELAWAELKITYPTAGSTVSGSVIEIAGVGADPAGTIEVSVLTDQWWVQDGKPEIKSNGSWTYAPCRLGGKGEYNNHTIKATIIKNGQRGESTSVHGIVRRD